MSVVSGQFLVLKDPGGRERRLAAKVERDRLVMAALPEMDLPGLAERKRATQSPSRFHTATLWPWSAMFNARFWPMTPRPMTPNCASLCAIAEEDIADRLPLMTADCGAAPRRRPCY